MQFPNGENRTDVFDLQKEINFVPNNFEEIVIKPAQLLDFAIKNKSTALKLTRILKENCKVKDVFAYACCTRKMGIDHVPHHFLKHLIFDYIFNNNGEIVKLYQQTDRYGILTGVRIHKMQKKDLLTSPLSNYLYFRKYKFYANWEDEESTCAFCAKVEHNEKNCDKKNKLKTKNENKRKLQQKLPTDETGIEPGKLPTIRHSIPRRTKQLPNYTKVKNYRKIVQACNKTHTWLMCHALVTSH